MVLERGTAGSSGPPPQRTGAGRRRLAITLRPRQTGPPERHSGSPQRHPAGAVFFLPQPLFLHRPGAHLCAGRPLRAGPENPPGAAHGDARAHGPQSQAFLYPQGRCPGSPPARGAVRQGLRPGGCRRGALHGDLALCRKRRSPARMVARRCYRNLEPGHQRRQR